MNPHAASANGQTGMFQGFEPLDANFVFCPNQFLDLVISTQSRPVVRLVAYVLYETLRWLDDEGQPVRQDIAVSFNDLVEKAVIARGSIRKAIAQAIDARLILCVKRGRPKSVDHSGSVGNYRLNWDETGHYAKSVAGFSGFYVGQGNRSPIPHSFFTRVIPNEPLAVTRVVATVLRHTVGYQNQYGGRRKQAQLSFRRIATYSGIASSSTLASALAAATEANYIRQVRPGTFSHQSSVQTAAVYAVNWLSPSEISTIGSKFEAAKGFKNRSRGSVQNSKQDGFNSQSRMGSNSEAAIAFKNRSNIKKSKNKQQRTVAAGQKSVQLLLDAGFDESAAQSIAPNSTPQNIENQIQWLRYRSATSNRLGLLRTAIEEKWPEPPAAVQKHRAQDHRQRDRQRQDHDRMRETGASLRRLESIKQWESAPAPIRLDCKARAIASETNPIVRKRLQRKTIDDPPPANFLMIFEQELSQHQARKIANTNQT